MTGGGDHLDRIMAVMQTGFDPAFGEAWTRRQVEDALIFGHSHFGLIAQHGAEPDQHDETAGFFLSRQGVEEEELLLIAVAPAFRGRGLGTALLQRFANEARQRGAKRLLLEMRRGNEADRLYRRFGFRPIGERPNYYRSQDGYRIDAITFAYDYE